ncbi:MAG: hypothetical protein ACFCUV_22350 [Rivularia sp. (in: cyanobacteria)]
MLSTETLNAYLQYLNTISDTISEIKNIALECECSILLGVARDGLENILQAIQPNNQIAIAMLKDASNVEDFEQSKYLENVAAIIQISLNEAIEKQSNQQNAQIKNVDALRTQNFVSGIKERCGRKELKIIIMALVNLLSNEEEWD